MGWGPLFFGYFLEFVPGMNQTVAPFIHILAWSLMCIGIGALERYCRDFRVVKWLAFALLLVSVPRTLAGLGEVFPSLSLSFMSATVTEVFLWVDFALMLAFHLFLALAIKALAGRVSLTKNAVAAIRNVIMVGLYALLYLICRIFPSNALLSVVFGVAILLRLVYSIANCVLLYSCYMRIQPAAGETKRPPSRIALINRFRRAFDEKEQKAIEADRAWHAENARAAREKRLARMSQKQRQRELEKERKRGSDTKK